MTKGTELATAYVGLVPSLQNLAKNINKAFQGTNFDSQAVKAGSEIGQVMGEAVKKSLVNKIANIGFAIQGVQSMAQQAGKLLDWTGSISKTQQRLKGMNDGTMTQDELNKKVYESAKKLGIPYGEMGENISKLGMLAGTAFNPSFTLVKQ
jgi:hypothetical protein